MKKWLLYITCLFCWLNHSLAQDCEDYELEGDCIYDERIGFKLFSQSTGTEIVAREPVEFKLILLGRREYIISLCTEKEYYPIHFTISDDDTKEILYDNKRDKYIESIGFELSNTRYVTITAEAPVGKKNDRDDLFSECMGLYIQYRIL